MGIDASVPEMPMSIFDTPGDLTLFSDEWMREMRDGTEANGHRGWMSELVRAPKSVESFFEALSNEQIMAVGMEWSSISSRDAIRMSVISNGWPVDAFEDQLRLRLRIARPMVVGNFFGTQLRAASWASKEGRLVDSRTIAPATLVVSNSTPAADLPAGSVDDALRSGVRVTKTPSELGANPSPIGP